MPETCGPSAAPSDSGAVFCSDIPTCDGVDWLTAESEHFVLHYLPGTDAERDLDQIIANRESAYSHILSTLGVQTSPRVDVTISPNRMAALAHHVSSWTALPGEDRYFMTYHAEPGSYETVHYGHELSHVLFKQIDPAYPGYPDFLNEGLAEFFDQTGRDLHQSYVNQLNGQLEYGETLTSFFERDQSGKNWGRAGSFVQFLIETYGMPTFLEIWRRTLPEHAAGCPNYPDCRGTPEGLQRFLAGMIEPVLGVPWREVLERWAAAIQPLWTAGPETVAAEDRQALNHLVSEMDFAIHQSDVTGYRALIEGFYCDFFSDDERMAFAERSLQRPGYTQSRIDSVVATNTINFRTATVFLSRMEDEVSISPELLFVERFPEGWKITWSQDWEVSE